MRSDAEIQQAFESLLQISPVNSDTLRKAAELLDQLRPESPVRLKLSQVLASWKASMEPRIKEDELRERFSRGGGRPLANILADLGRSA